MQKISFILMLTLFLTGCLPKYQVNYTYHPPATLQGKACVKQCSKARSSCQQACNVDHNYCEYYAYNEGVFQFRQYQSQVDKIPDRQRMTLDAFVHDAKCTRSCGCTRQFNRCYSSCGGGVVVHRKCVEDCYYPWS